MRKRPLNRRKKTIFATSRKWSLFSEVFHCYHLFFEDVILSGCNGYSEHWTQEISDAMGDPDFVTNTLVPHAGAKGFGKDEVLMGELDARGVEPIAPEDPSGFDTPGNR